MMKKTVAVLMCLTLVLSMLSCDADGHKDEEALKGNDTSAALNDVAVQTYEAAINDEICVVDERLGEASLKSLRFTGDGTALGECKLLMKAIFDADQDGVGEYIIKSPDNDCIVLRYLNGKVYTYHLDVHDYYKLNPLYCQRF